MNVLAKLFLRILSPRRRAASDFPLVRHPAADFPRVRRAVAALAAQVRPEQLGVERLFIYGSYLRHALTGAEPFADVDVAVCNHADVERLTPARRGHFFLYDFSLRRARRVRLEVNEQAFGGPSELMHYLADYTVAALVYAWPEEALYCGVDTLECIAARDVGRSNLSLVTPIRSYARLYKLTRNGYAVQQGALLEAIAAHRNRPWLRRLAERRWLLRFGDLSIVTPHDRLL